MRKKHHCALCNCPLILFSALGMVRSEVRYRCASCRPIKMANPCRVKGCLGEVEAPSKILCGTCAHGTDKRRKPTCECGECRKCRKREVHRVWQSANKERVRVLNKQCYEAHRDQYLEHRRSRRKVLGDQIRASDRAKYAAKHVQRELSNVLEVE